MNVIIVIDMQKDFIDGVLGTKEAQAILPAVIKRVEDSKDELILFTHDTHQADYLQTPEGKKLPIVHCIEGTEGWQFNEKILNAWKQNQQTIRLSSEQEHHYYKSAFGSVKLAEDLATGADEISAIELMGVCTDICVISNALMIKNMLPNVAVSVNAALCAGVTPESHDAALKVLEMCQVDVFYTRTEHSVQS
jgi:nicotinamidase-related amidase